MQISEYDSVSVLADHAVLSAAAGYQQDFQMQPTAVSS